MDDIIERMQSYGDRVQFDLPGKGQRPNYQVINTAGKKIAFDSKSFLLKPNENGDVSDNLSAIFTLAQIKAAKTYSGIKVSSPRARSSTSAGSGTRSNAGASRSAPAPAKVVDTIDADKYLYFKNNRDMLPEGIQKYSDQVGQLMRTGMSAEEAFEEVIKQHF
jgi:hypothetical protein